ncbi:GNAT family N-acetyltransferase [Myroides sp. NP-2]|uniref:GNAT family N-acetyltransferase n=1 Tax=Myroides sp. NP-2 TaxID=2759945 RepID=UPI0015F9E2A8|nr:GNAT family N-acetyltransferase [Myroides sp. NP-2]MBB1150525.1 GNAT family N-acetyltransferase [Myroides sp. NP-2]
MLGESLQITEIKDKAYPMSLLLLADETVEAIGRYIDDSRVYSVCYQQEEMAVFCLYPLTADTLEIKNIAVAEAFQNKQIGSFLLDYIKVLAKEQNYKTLIVGTGDTGDAQIRFYQRNGFVLFDKRKNFFIDYYPEPIFENGRQLVDMVLLKWEVDQD